MKGIGVVNYRANAPPVSSTTLQRQLHPKTEEVVQIQKCNYVAALMKIINFLPIISPIAGQV